MNNNNKMSIYFSINNTLSNYKNNINNSVNLVASFLYYNSFISLLLNLTSLLNLDYEKKSHFYVSNSRVFLNNRDKDDSALCS